jgi:large subunit ribosomal protein L23
MSKEHYYNIIRGPSVTEKGTLVSEKNQVVFNVALGATKPAIKKAIEGLFGVKVKAVNTLVRKGKLRRFKGRPALLSDSKKAYVTLEEGQRLDVTTGL